MTALARPRPPSLPIGLRSIAAGLIAAGLLLAVYLGIIAVAQGPSHALDQLGADALFVSLIAAGFGVQITLFAELRTIDRRHRAGAAVTAAGTGTSTAAMLACCAHHLVDLLPIVGLSAFAVFLNVYRTPLFLLGIGMNLVGIIVIGRQLRRARQACAIADGAPVHGGAHDPAHEPAHEPAL